MTTQRVVLICGMLIALTIMFGVVLWFMAQAISTNGGSSGGDNSIALVLGIVTSVSGLAGVVLTKLMDVLVALVRNDE